MNLCKTCLAVLLLAMGPGLLPVCAASGAEADKLTAFFKTYLDESFRQHPTDATGLGDHRFDNQLDDISAPARARWLALSRETLADLPKLVNYRLLAPGPAD